MAAPPSMRVGLFVLGLGTLAAPQARLFMALSVESARDDVGFGLKADERLTSLLTQIGHLTPSIGWLLFAGTVLAPVRRDTARR